MDTPEEANKKASERAANAYQEMMGSEEMQGIFHALTHYNLSGPEWGRLMADMVELAYRTGFEVGAACAFERAIDRFEEAMGENVIIISLDKLPDPSDN